MKFTCNEKIPSDTVFTSEHSDKMQPAESETTCSKLVT